MIRFILSDQIRVKKYPEIAIAVIVIVLFGFIKLSTAETSTPQVLILNAYHQGEDWSDKQLAGILPVLKNSYPYLIPSIEHLDSKRFPDSKHLLFEKEYLKSKYQGKQFDLIMALDNSALDLILTFRQELFTNIPIVFAGVNGYRPEMLGNHKKITGVAEVQDMEGTLKLVLKIHPDTKTVFAVHDHTSSGLAVLKDMKSIADKFKGVTIKYTPEGTVDDLVAQLKALNKDAIVMLLTYVTDKNGRTLTREESTRLITKSSPVPVYAMHETRLGYGIVGGVLLEGIEHGKQAAEIALEILSGTQADNIKVLNSHSRKVFDYDQMKRFKIPITKLPSDSVIVNQPISFIKQHQSLLIPGSILVCLLTVILIIMTFSIIRIKNAEKSLQKSDMKYRTLFENMVQGAFYQRSDGVLTDHNPAVLEMFGITSDQFMGKISSDHQWKVINEDGSDLPGDQHPSMVALTTGKPVYNKLAGVFNPQKKDYVWVIINAMPQFNPGEDKPAQVFVTLHEVTALKQAEYQLRRHKNRYMSILYTAIDGFWITDSKGNFLEVNEAYSHMSGYSLDELLTMKISDVEANETPEIVAKHLEKGITFGYDRFESIHRRKDNSTYHVEINFTYSEQEGEKFVVFIKDINERKKAEENLLKKQYYLTKAQELGKIGTWELDIQKNILIWTEENYKIFGVPLETELTYEYFLDCIHPDDRDFVHEKWTAALNNEQYDITHRIIVNDKVTWVREKANIEFDPDGKAITAVGFTQDITELKQTEQILEESELKFKRLFEQAPLSYQSLDEQGNFTEVNQTWIATMGYRTDEVLGKNFSEFLIPENKSHFEENFPRFKAVGEVLGVEFEMVKKDGSTILVSFHGKIGKDSHGNFKQTHCVFSDISIQKTAENTLKKDLKLNKAIAEISKELLSEVYDIKKVSDATLGAVKSITRSEHGFVSSIDKKTLENVGHTLTEMFGEACKMKNQRIAFPIREDGNYGGLWGHALNTKQAFFTNNPGTHPCSTGIPDGHIPLKNYMAVPVLMGDKLLGLIALSNSAHDYSKDDIESVNRIAEIFALALHRQVYESKRIDMELNLRQLQKNEAIGALAGGIAHDFNNILFPIIGFAEMLEEDIPDNSPFKEGINEILTGAKRAKELVKQILTFSRQVEQELKPLKPHLVIKEVIKLIKSTIPTSIEIKQSIDPNCRTIMADPTQIHQVAMNLITNAYHAMQDSGGTLSITLKNIDLYDYLEELRLDAGPHILLTIEDTGEGMDQRTIEKIFDPYFTTKPKGKGTGLGLSVVHGIIKNYSGDIEVKSVLGEGSTFNIYLPAFESYETLQRTSQKELPRQGSESILLVDDEQSILRLEEQMLERLGYEVDSTDSSENALTLIKNNPEKYDLIISDMTMPKMTGDTLAKEVRKVNADLPIIICTGFSEKLTSEKASAIGINAVLTKPIIKIELSQTIRNVLDNN